jgi:(1->4)-alpha-D-glucan 1-alpha-D-glucosylmutase
LTAIGYLPPRTGLTAEKISERHREKEIIKKRIAALTAQSPQFLEAIQSALKKFNGVATDPRSFDLLDKLLEDQPYRPAFWRVASEEINYRRFFDINELTAIRVERPEVFAATHQLVFQLIADGTVTGLRIDHPDGLWDPGRYFRQLQEQYLIDRSRKLLGPARNPDGLEGEVRNRLQALWEASPRPAALLYVVAEKILGEHEPLPTNWPVSGTTGYDFLNAVGGLLVDSTNRDAFEAIYRSFIGQRLDFTTLVRSCQKMIMLVSMSS